MPRLGPRLHAIAALALALAANSCSSDPLRFEQIYSIQGSVILAGTPQADVRVEFSNASGTAVAFSGSDGTFILSGALNGDYQVTPVMAGQAFRPASRVVTLNGADVRFVSFFRHGSPTHIVSGTASDIAGVRLNLTGDNAAAVLSRVGGAFRIPSLRVGSYTLTPTKTGVTFTPASVDIDGVIDFVHSESGTIGVVSTASVTYDDGTNDASAFFEFPAVSAQGIGTIRPKRSSEVATGGQVVYEALWQSAKTVTFTMNSAQGAQTILFHLMPDHTYFATSTNFALTERLVNAIGITFTATMP